jgi:hypothetical protein
MFKSSRRARRGIADMLLNQINQVGLTYLTQRYLWWGLLFFVLVVGPQLVLANRPNRSPADAAQPMMMVLGFPMLFALPFLVGHVKAQLAHARARLTPNFLPAHLIVLGGILITIFLLYPLFLTTLCPFGLLSYVALALAIGAPAVWGPLQSDGPNSGFIGSLLQSVHELGSAMVADRRLPACRGPHAYRARGHDAARCLGMAGMPSHRGDG